MPRIRLLLVVLVIKASYKNGLMAWLRSRPQRERGDTSCWVSPFMRQQMLCLGLWCSRTEGFFVSSCGRACSILDPTGKNWKAEHGPNSSFGEAFWSRSSRTAFTKLFNFPGVSVKTSSWGCINLVKEHNRNPFFYFIRKSGCIWCAPSGLWI